MLLQYIVSCCGLGYLYNNRENIHLQLMLTTEFSDNIIGIDFAHAICGKGVTDGRRILTAHLRNNI